MGGVKGCCLSALPRTQGKLAVLVHQRCMGATQPAAFGSFAAGEQQTLQRFDFSKRQISRPCIRSMAQRRGILRAPLSLSSATGTPHPASFCSLPTTSPLKPPRFREGKATHLLWRESSTWRSPCASSATPLTSDSDVSTNAPSAAATSAPPSEPAAPPAAGQSSNGTPQGSRHQSSAYPFQEIEAKWQAEWERGQTFRTPEEVDTTKPKFYVLDMFPYPSGAGLHVGHPEGYTATDIMARYKRMKGFNVLHPMGWDAFGLPAEQYAIETGTHPRVTTQKNINRFRTQLKQLGFSYDWQREISTTDPEYYKWTQWIFLQIFNRGLAYQANVAVNWCPALGTVLANEEVVDGLSERGGHPVIRKPMRQWMLRITAYADRLLEDLEDLDWPESIKEMQRNWIGRSEGAELEFGILGEKESSSGSSAKCIRVFTTRPDTLCGATYLVLAPEHELVSMITTPERKAQVDAYVEAAGRKSDLERTELQKDKTGEDTGAKAINPATGEEIPIWVADYVLGSYGTGAIMAVPAHDSRDFEFASTFGLPMREVVRPESAHESSAEAETEAGAEGGVYAGAGVLVNSFFSKTGLDLNGKSSEEAAKEVTQWLEDKGIGKKQVNFKLRDWLFARQRYWGEPFPLLLVESDTNSDSNSDSDSETALEERLVAVAVPESDLPITLPEIENFSPTGTGEPPLAKATDWLSTVDPASGKPALRETNTMPQWAGSCWYYLRFIDPRNSKALVDPDKEKYWGPVDLYVGGAEHSVLHLLYARFWHKVLFDIGVVSTKEPFQRLVNQGMILGEVEFTCYRDESGAYVSPDQASSRQCIPERIPEDQVLKKGEGYVLKSDPSIRVSARAHKMSKSRGNVVNPDDVVFEFGADSLRLYEMFMGPLRETKIWSTKGVEGVHRFLARVWRLALGQSGGGTNGLAAAAPGLNGGAVSLEAEPTKEQLKAINQCIKKVTEELEALRFNTAIAAMMEFVNLAYKWESVPVSVFEPLVLLLSPFAPHISEELWSRLGHTQSLVCHPWPEANLAYLKEDAIKIPVQVNGKVRTVLEVEIDADQDSIVAAAIQDPAVMKFLDGKQIKKQIFVPKKILNLIVA